MTDPTERTRRYVLKGASSAGAAVVAGGGGMVNIVGAQTASGNVELVTTSTIPTDTSILATVTDETAGENEQQSITAGTDVVTEFPNLSTTNGSGNTVVVEFQLQNTDFEATPTMTEPVTVRLPEGETTTTQDPTTTTDDGTATTSDGTTTGPIGTGDGSSTPGQGQGIGALWQNYRAFIALVVLAFAAIGGWSKSLTIGAFSAYLAFLYLALNSSNQMFQNIAIVTLVLTFLGMAFKLVRLEFEGET